MTEFHVYCEDTDEIGTEKLTALEKAVAEYILADMPVAVELAFLDGEGIRDYNKRFRSVDKVTDVLSFPAFDLFEGEGLQDDGLKTFADEDGNLMIGTIIICPERAKEQAEEYGHSYDRELHYLIVHGVMHCLGFDHETDEERAKMRAQEERVLLKLGITRGE